MVVPLHGALLTPWGQALGKQHGSTDHRDHDDAAAEALCDTVHRRATSPCSCRWLPTPSAMRMWVYPMCLMNSSCLPSGMSKVRVTRKMVPMMSMAAYPSLSSDMRLRTLPSTSPSAAHRTISRTVRGCGWSQTLKTVLSDTMPKPAYV